MLTKHRSKRQAPIVYLFVWVILVSLFTYLWKLSGCVGIPNCYLCRTFTPDTVINPLAISSTADDFSKLMNLRNFTFLINNYVCNNTDLLLIVLVHSAPHNFEKRSNIRNTWGKVFSNKFKLLFMLGIPNDTAVQKRIEEENNLNGDVVQGNFKDSYRNLTYKHVMVLKWTKYFCPNAKYMLKTDDDVFVNSPGFLRYLSLSLPQTKLMQCLPIYEGRAQRTSRSKWKVTWTEYQFRTYPPYCQGFAILYTPDVVVTLYAKAQASNYFWIDDVFITGFLAMSVSITPTTFGNHILDCKHFQKVVSEETESFSYLLGPWDLSIGDIKKLWRRAHKAQGDLES